LHGGKSPATHQLVSCRAAAFGNAHILGYTSTSVSATSRPAQRTAKTDRAVIRMADELLYHSEISEQTWTMLAKSFSHAELIELLLAAGFRRALKSLEYCFGAPEASAAKHHGVYRLDHFNFLSLRGCYTTRLDIVRGR
jgi:hypothetical protein